MSEFNSLSFQLFPCFSLPEFAWIAVEGRSGKLSVWTTLNSPNKGYSILQSQGIQVQVQQMSEGQIHVLHAQTERLLLQSSACAHLQWALKGVQRYRPPVLCSLFTSSFQTHVFLPNARTPHCQRFCVFRSIVASGLDIEDAATSLTDFIGDAGAQPAR